MYIAEIQDYIQVLCGTLYLNCDSSMYLQYRDHYIVVCDNKVVYELRIYCYSEKVVNQGHVP